MASYLILYRAGRENRFAFVKNANSADRAACVFYVVLGADCVIRSILPQTEDTLPGDPVLDSDAFDAAMRPID